MKLKIFAMCFALALSIASADEIKVNQPQAQEQAKAAPPAKSEDPAPQWTDAQKFQVRDIQVKMMGLQNQFVQLQQQAQQLNDQQKQLQQQMGDLAKTLCPETAGKKYQPDMQSLTCIAPPPAKPVAPDKLPGQK